jgi:hypothetical protein
VFNDMSTQQARRQMPAPAGRTVVARGEAAREAVSDEACGSRHETKNTGSALLHAALARENLQQALKRVRANKGAPGVDGLDIDQTARHLVTAWPAIREQLDAARIADDASTKKPVASAARHVSGSAKSAQARRPTSPASTERAVQQASDAVTDSSGTLRHWRPQLACSP